MPSPELSSGSQGQTESGEKEFKRDPTRDGHTLVYKRRGWEVSVYDEYTNADGSVRQEYNGPLSLEAGLKEINPSYPPSLPPGVLIGMLAQQ